MPWLQREAKIVAVASFIGCQQDMASGEVTPHRLSVRVLGCLLQLTSPCGAACTLAYSGEQTAAYWGLRVLTDQFAAVPGAVQSGNLTRLELPYFKSLATTPARRDIVKLMKQQAQPETAALRRSSTERIVRKLNGVLPDTPDVDLPF